MTLDELIVELQNAREMYSGDTPVTAWVQDGNRYRIVYVDINIDDVVELNLE